MATTYDVLRKLMIGMDVPDLEQLVPRPDWMRQGACTDPSLTGVNFFPRVGEMTTAAKAVCAQCDVREQCLEFALEHREVHGVRCSLVTLPSAHGFPVNAQRTSDVVLAESRLRANPPTLTRRWETAYSPQLLPESGKIGRCLVQHPEDQECDQHGEHRRDQLPV